MKALICLTFVCAVFVAPAANARETRSLTRQQVRVATERYAIRDVRQHLASGFTVDRVQRHEARIIEYGVTLSGVVVNGAPYQGDYSFWVKLRRLDARHVKVNDPDIVGHALITRL